MTDDPRQLAEKAIAIHEGCDDPGCLQIDLARALLAALDRAEAAERERDTLLVEGDMREAEVRLLRAEAAERAALENP